MPRPVVKKSRKTKQPRRALRVETIEVDHLDVTPELIETEPDMPGFSDNAQDLTHMDDTEPEPAPSTSRAPPTSAFAQPGFGKKKSNRVPHRQIPNFPFSDDQMETVRNFILSNEALWHKRHREYSNHVTKLDLWHKCAELFPEEGGPTWLQCRKFFEQRRTAYGKVEAAEQRSGSARRHRTAREETLMTEWRFLSGHITHVSTTSSHAFHTDAEQDTASSGNESTASVLSVTSIIRRREEERRKKKRPASSTLDLSAPVDPDDVEPVDDVLPSIASLISRAQKITEENTEPWANTNIYHFSKMIARQVYELPPPERNEAMHRAMTMMLELQKRINQKIDVECQTTEHPEVTAAPAPPPPMLAVPPSPLQPTPALPQPTPAQPQPTPALQQIMHGQAFQQSPIIHGPAPMYSTPVQYQPAPTAPVHFAGNPPSGNWIQPHLYYPATYPQVPPPSTPSQPASTIPTSAQPASTSGSVAPVITTPYTPITTSGSVTSSPQGSLQNFRDVLTTTANTLNTPLGSNDEDAPDNS